MSKRDLFLSVMRNEKPVKWMGSAFDAFPDGAAVFGASGAERLFHAIIDPITNWDILAWNGEYYLDNWGVAHRYIIGKDPGIIPLTNESNKVIKDITEWKKYVKFPEIPADLDWSVARANVDKYRAEGNLIMVPSFRGLFERLHSLEPMEDVMVDMVVEPEACNEFFAAYTDWKLEVFKQIIDNLQPDIIHSHDDLGSLTSPFMSPETFREMLKPHYAKLYGYVKSRGVLVQHHCDCYIEPFALDFAEIGVDMWQGALPTNNIKWLQQEEDKRGLNMLLMGGIDQTLVDKEPYDAKKEPSGVTDDQIRAEIRRAIDEYAPGGHFLPCIGSIQCLHDHATEVCEDEMNKYGAEWLAKHK